MNQAPYHPIIYVRGFAGTQGEVEDTVADPYMGFNIGSTKCRQEWTGQIKKFFFESPMVRLFKEHNYDDVYVDGSDQLLESGAREPIPYRSIIIYRYYEQASKDLGSGKLPEMEDYARGLSDLILKLRDRVCTNPENNCAQADFRVYLVAHSMGGLVCRAFLQNPALSDPEARAAVDKVFTYATPHNGIDMQWIGNMPNWFSFHNTNDFNRTRMGDYLDIQGEVKDRKSAALLQNFDPRRFFCLVGTNASDYSAARGMAKMVVGDCSDGLVQVRNAAVYGYKKERKVESPRAFVHRSHSGHYGIVNSEEGYQNLTRFFFGNVRVDGVLHIDEITLPAKVAEKKAAGKKVKASYHIEVVLSVRGKTWQMHRRTLQENSAIFRKYDELFDAAGQPNRESSPHLFSCFLDKHKRVRPERPSLGFAVDLSVLVPDYEIDGFLFLDNHYEGGNIFRDRMIVEATPPDAGGKWAIRYGFESETPGEAPKVAAVEVDVEGISFTIPIEQPNPPGIKARLCIRADQWNNW